MAPVLIPLLHISVVESSVVSREPVLNVESVESIMLVFPVSNDRVTELPRAAFGQQLIEGNMNLESAGFHV